VKRASSHFRVSIWCAAFAVSSAAVCCSYETQTLSVPAADAEVFEQTVYPVLLADCGFAACHGSHDRPLSIFGPGRTRLSEDTEPYAAATAAELALSHARARSMLISPDGARRAPLLRKPLAVSAGGSEHLGNDAWGANVFPSKRDERYETLFYWAIASEAPMAEE
jgi:hypothetical protein